MCHSCYSQHGGRQVHLISPANNKGTIKIIVQHLIKYRINICMFTNITISLIFQYWWKPSEKNSLRITLPSTIRSWVKLIKVSWMNVTHCPIVMHSCAKYGITISTYKKSVARTRVHVKDPMNFTTSHIGIMNVGDTNLHRQTDRVIPTYPPPPLRLLSWGV